ncbi:MAG: heavy metal-binding domain-containing protein [Thiohalobacteraceae bacterium]
MRLPTTVFASSLTTYLSAILSVGLMFNTASFAADATHADASLPMIQLQAVADMDDAIVLVCPMHPEVQSHEPGRCPQCKMALVERDPEDD